jgi:SAM-dependent methyltransferase
MKQIARAVLRRLGLIRQGRPPSESLERAYWKKGGIPWSPGYNEAKVRFIRESLSTAEILAQFRAGELPKRFGVGFDERCVEYPWLFSQLHGAPESVLDAGSALNHEFILDHPVFRKKQLSIVTLAPEGVCFWQRGISYLYGDLRDLPIRDEYCDTIVCLSTLEHVGCDNSIYRKDGSAREERLGDFVLVMKSLYRVLKPGGSLFLTVPFGVYRYFGAFQQFDRDLLSRAVAAFGEARALSESFYRYDRDGWHTAKAADCAACQYVHWVADVWLSGQWPKPLPVERDRAAAARAVACVRLTKA